MTIDLSQETQLLIDKALESGQFQTAEQAIQYSLRWALTDQAIPKDKPFAQRVDKALAEANEDIAAARVRSFTKESHHQLFDEIIERGKKRLAETKK